jgi:hypothetical protein
MDRPNWSRNVLMQNALEHNPWDYQEFMDSSPEGSVDAPSGVQPNPDSGPTGKDPLENILSMGSFLPGLGGDFLGPLSDLRAMQQDPNKRTLANIALFGVGALPAVPSLLSMMNRASDLPIHRGVFGNQSGALGYHGTKNPNFDNSEFHALSHFGSTPTAANDRIGIPNVSQGVIKNYLLSSMPHLEGSHIRKVDLNIKNPLRIEDYGGQHEPLDFVRAAVDKNALTDREYNALLEVHRINPDLVAPALIKKLKSKGYDGFVYENKAEDIGQDSYVIFDKSQVHSGLGKRESAFGNIPKENKKKLDLSNHYEVFDAQTGRSWGFFPSKDHAVEKMKELRSKYPFIDYEKYKEK